MRKIRANTLSGSEWLKNSFSIWRNIAKTSEERKIKHPATFPIALVEKILDCFVPISDHTPIVLDCFVGSGSTLIASDKKSYKAVGIDNNPMYQKLFLNNCSIEKNTIHYVLGNALDTAAYTVYKEYDICITSPPYWDILRARRTVDTKEIRPYSDSKDDIGNISNYQEFLEKLQIIFKNVFNVLGQGRYFIVNVGDIRKKSNFYPLHIDMVEIGKKAGFTLCDIIIWDRQNEYNSMRPLGYPYKFIINKVHEYLLVLKKE